MPFGARPGHRRPRWFRQTAWTAALLLAATLGGLTAAQASVPARAAAAHAALPPFQGQDSAVYIDGKTVVSKAAVRMDLPVTLLRVDANYDFKFVPPDNPTVLETYSHAWAVSPAGSSAQYGYFPPVQVSTLAFGSVPVTATVQLSQTFTGADPDPMQIFGHGLLDTPYTVYPTEVTGNLRIRLSDVRVDQEPLDVGPDCHSRTPMPIKLYGISPDYNLFYGGPLSGTVTIPPFAGCGSHGEDLDPLLTGLISGPNNPLSMRQGDLGNWIEPDGPCDSVCSPPLDHASQ
ncbi:MAG TPA: hypothetical protein VMB79_10380 [Jatrophihabitans sp.]|nr:hypothetical protein [Jatrophihabitans sp.]